MERCRLLQQYNHGPSPLRPGALRENRRGGASTDSQPQDHQLHQQRFLRSHPGVQPPWRPQVPPAVQEPLLRENPVGLLLPDVVPKESLALREQLHGPNTGVIGTASQPDGATPREKPVLREYPLDGKREAHFVRPLV